LIRHTFWDSITKLSSAKKTSRAILTSYIELQYHGLLTIDNVESITLPDKPEKLISSEILSILKEKEIKLFYEDSDTKNIIEFLY